MMFSQVLSIYIGVLISVAIIFYIASYCWTTAGAHAIKRLLEKDCGEDDCPIHEQ